jgi:hypothetical protein
MNTTLFAGRRLRLVGALLIFVLLGAVRVQADRGAIPFHPEATIFEPNQRALIAWNGDEEILVLTTDLRASQPTKVLEVMPFPAEPRVAKADVAVFRRAIKLINSKLNAHARRYGGDALGQSKAAEAAPAPPPGEITFHEKIGAHDVAVARVVTTEGFIEWVNDFLKRASVDNPVIPARLRSVVQEYLDEGFRWFAFDVVSLEKTFKSTEALQYRFDTSWLYYPVKISRANRGETAIELLVLSPRLVSAFSGIPRDQIDLRHPPVSLTSREVRSLNSEMDALLGHCEDAKLRIWRVNGDFDALDRDVLAR